MISLVWKYLINRHKSVLLEQFGIFLHERFLYFICSSDQTAPADQHGPARVGSWICWGGFLHCLETGGGSGDSRLSWTFPRSHLDQSIAGSLLGALCGLVCAGLQSLPAVIDPSQIYIGTVGIKSFWFQRLQCRNLSL